MIVVKAPENNGTAQDQDTEKKPSILGSDFALGADTIESSVLDDELRLATGGVFF